MNEKIELTDEIRQGGNEDVLAWLIFNLQTEYMSGLVREYEVFIDEREARQLAAKNAERTGDGKPWPIYPLYASHPIHVEI